MKVAEDYLAAVLRPALPANVPLRNGRALEEDRLIDEGVVIYSMLPGARDMYTYGETRSDRTQYVDLRYEVRSWSRHSDAAVTGDLSDVIDKALNPGPDDRTEPPLSGSNPGWHPGAGWELLSALREGPIAYQIRDVRPGELHWSRGGIYRLIFQYDEPSGP